MRHPTWELTVDANRIHWAGLAIACPGCIAARTGAFARALLTPITPTRANIITAYLDKNNRKTSNTTTLLRQHDGVVAP